MKIHQTSLQDCYVVEPTLFKDERGYFFESFNENKFNELTGNTTQFVQDNQSFSSYGVLRGLHFQQGLYAQAKLVRVLQGVVLDVAVDLRLESPTYGKYFTIELTAENNLQLFIPRGFAHGFVVLSEVATFFYKCDNFYHKASEGGILYNDPALNIDWQVPATDILVSEKDRVLPSFNQLAQIA
jgi:dTDP-4-dehydrorhamnose 3,5-epimerase